ncbi:MAG: DnaJ domain-containing protein [Treponema sp.]|nr:DnaJ domain-containing protein [Treponema sp.]
MTLFDEVKKGYYETLGIAKTAGGAEIKKAYFSMVRKYQPDRFPEEFKEIRTAYEILTDPKKRAEYDAIGKLPPSVASFFHEALWFEHIGRHGKAAEYYQMILKSHPELDNVREQYARSLSADDKTGKAVEVWEELCSRHPKNPEYARQLGQSYLDRSWSKKALSEANRAIDLDRSSIENWLLLIACTIEQERNKPALFDHLHTISLKALKAVSAVKTDEWKKIPLHVHALVTTGIEKIATARDHLREISRLTREGGRAGRDEGGQAFREILVLLPASGLAGLYPDLRELAGLLPDMHDKKTLRKFDDVRLSFEIEGLAEKGFHEIFQDLFRLLISEFEDEEDELEIIAIEYNIIDNRDLYYPQLRRLREEFPDIYALHGSFFNEALRTRDPDKMLYRRAKKYDKLKRDISVEYPEDEPEQPVRRAEPKVGRNDPCPCGSGKKYKHCHGRPVTN